MEGVVVKSLQATEIPYLKVRNEQYLTLVYGPHFREPSVYSVMVQKKNIHHKLKQSEIEWKLGKKMLCIPYSTFQNNDLNNLQVCSNDTLDQVRLSYQSLLISFFSEEDQVSATMDARL